MTVTFEREMAIGVEEFLRVLPAAAATALNAAAGPQAGAGMGGEPPPAAASAETPPYEISGRTIVVGEGGRRVEIRLLEQQPRRLGSVSLPVTRVRFEAHGFTEEETARFMKSFDLHYQRGGG